MRKLHVAYLTTSNRGSDSANEDSILINQNVISGESSGSETYEADQHGFFAISDGLHGTSKKSHASSNLLRLLAKDIKLRPNSHAGQRITRLNDEYSTLGAVKSCYRGMAATLVGVEYGNDAIQVFHVGDSRAWHMSESVCTPLTADHTIANLEKIDGEELSSMYNILDGYFAVDSELPRPKNSYTTVHTEDLKTLVLASDGISVIGKELPLCSASMPLKDYIIGLKDQAIQLGSDDNISIIALRLE
jgi:serine/threonine protein phosphatase PrpC